MKHLKELWRWFWYDEGILWLLLILWLPLMMWWVIEFNRRFL